MKESFLFGTNVKRLCVNLFAILLSLSTGAKSFTAEYLADCLDEAEKQKATGREITSDAWLVDAPNAITYRYESNSELLYIENTSTDGVRNVTLRLRNTAFINQVTLEAFANEGASSFLMGAYWITEDEESETENMFAEKELNFNSDLNEVTATCDFVFRFYLAAGEAIMINRIDLGERTDATFEWSASYLSIALGSTPEWPVLNTDDLYWDYKSHTSYSSSNEDVARINSEGKVTVKACGVTTISAHLEKTINHGECSTSYTLLVTPYEVFGSIEDITLTLPNTLRYILADLETTSIGKLTLHGPMGSDDLACLRNNGRLSKLQVLNMADVTLAADEGQYTSLQTAKSDIGMGTTVTTYFLSEREEVTKETTPTGLGGSNIKISYYTMSLGGLFANLDSLKSITLPTTLDKVGSFMCAGCTNLIDVILPNDVSEVEEGAFSYCTNLRNINLYNPSSIGKYAFNHTMVSRINLSQVTIMGESAFCESNLEGADLSSLKEIPTNAFKSCNNLKTLVLGNNLTLIGESAFTSTAVTSLNLPEGLTTIGTQAFLNSKVTDITIPATLLRVGWEAFRNTPWILSQKGIDGIVYLGNVALGGDISNQLTPTIKLHEGTTVLADLFFDYYLYSVNANYTRNISSVNDNYFTSISLPSSLRAIGDYALCQKYTGIKHNLQYSLPEGLEYIGKHAFAYNTAITSLTIPKSVTSIGDGAFESNTSLLNLRYEAEAAGGRNIFQNCTALEKVTFGEGVRIIPEDAFSYCNNLLKVTFEESQAHKKSNPLIANRIGSTNQGVVISNYAFSGCSQLRTIDFPANIDSIGEGAFQSTGLPTANLINGVRTIGAYAFANCPSLTKVTLPTNIKYLNGTGLDNSPITSIYSYATAPPQITGNTYKFTELAKAARVYVLPKCPYIYDANPIWSQFTIIPMNDEEVALGVDGFKMELPLANASKQVFYDLAGRRVKNCQPLPGIYIVNGKKIKL